jgi:hypothetical protein
MAHFRSTKVEFDRSWNEKRHDITICTLSGLSHEKRVRGGFEK